MQLHELEIAAKKAKEANSYNEYQAGSASKDFLDYCERADAVAAQAIERLERKNAPQDRMDQVKKLLAKYKVNKLNWMVEVYSNRASVSSIMIAGPANFPVRKKEQQNAREKNLYKNDPEYIVDKIESIGCDAGTIRSDDENAVERIKEKIARLEALPPDKYGYNKTEVRRLRSRLLELAPEEFVTEQEQATVNGVRTYEEIVKLWDGGVKSTHDWGGTIHHYWNLPLIFYNGKRHYKELLSLRITEDGKSMVNYKNETIALTDEKKYALIINKINGSGNKAIMFQFFNSLTPSVQAAKKEAEEREASGENETVIINNDKAEVIRNKEAMRLQLIFDGKPEVETRNNLKANGFRWAPSFGAWQRLLNTNAEYALKRISDKQ